METEIEVMHSKDGEGFASQGHEKLKRARK